MIKFFKFFNINDTDQDRASEWLLAPKRPISEQLHLDDQLHSVELPASESV